MLGGGAPPCSATARLGCVWRKVEDHSGCRTRSLNADYGVESRRMQDPPNGGVDRHRDPARPSKWEDEAAMPESASINTCQDIVALQVWPSQFSGMAQQSQMSCSCRLNNKMIWIPHRMARIGSPRSTRETVRPSCVSVGYTVWKTRPAEANEVDPICVRQMLSCPGASTEETHVSVPVCASCKRTVKGFPYRVEGRMLWDQRHCR